MRSILPFLFLLLFCKPSKAQNLDGQWKGSFTDESSGISEGQSPIEYVLEFSTKGNVITGSSYTYYYEGGKKIYSICSIAGTIDRAKKSILINEVKRIMTNEPVSNPGFQKHILYYSEKNGSTILKGKWEDVTRTNSTAHWGYTSLARRTLKSLPQIAHLNIANKAEKKTAEKLIAKNDKVQKPGYHIEKKIYPVAVIENPVSFADYSFEKVTHIVPPSEITVPILLSQNYFHSFRQRKNDLIQVIATSTSSIKIELYDNGEIDGDSVSLFYNNVLLLSHARLGEKPTTIMVDVENNPKLSNELVMYAENLGTIPPNTALMVITDGNKRYELRISSDLEKSGSVKFVRAK